MRTKFVRLILGTAIALVSQLAPLHAQFAYVANLDSNNVSAYRIGSGGVLTPVPGSPFPAGPNPADVTVDPTGRFAYVVNDPGVPEVPGTVSVFAICSDGALKPVPGSPFPAGDSPAAVVVDPTDRFVYIVNVSVSGQLGAVTAFNIGPNGALTPVPGSPFAAGSLPEALAVDPRGRFLFVATGGAISAFSIGPDGALGPVPGSPFPAGFGTNSVTVDPTGKFVYAPNEFGNNVSAYSIGSDGALTPLSGSPFATDAEDPLAVTVDPTGRFAYVVSFLFDVVEAYSIGSDGALTPMNDAFFATGNQPRALAIDPTGRFAYVPNFQTVSSLSGYSIGSDGALTPIPGSPFATGAQAISVALTPNVPFASFFAKLEVEERHRGGFELKDFFTLGTNSNGIDPLTENVTLQIGPFSATIPAGSFKQDPNGKFAFKGEINEIRLEVQIIAAGNNIYTLKAEGKGADLDCLSNPVTVGLTIGIDSGSTAVRAEFERRKKRDCRDEDGREDK
jgi:6-phosphogluconolactonase